jgi:dTDP-glucose 4,6-dehydratase
LVFNSLKGKCCVHDDGSSERDFLYIDDVVNAFVFLLHKGRIGNYYNIGADKGLTILKLARVLSRLVGKTHGTTEDEDNFIEFVPGRLIDDKRYKIDSSHIKSLGWRPKISLEEGLLLTIQWYKSNPNYWPNSDYALEPHSSSLTFKSS